LPLARVSEHRVPRRMHGSWPSHSRAREGSVWGVSRSGTW
jgi:hypothetical protein